MKLILARHGNTFAATDKVCWVGSQNDLPLVDSGVAQATRAAQALKDIPLAAIYFAPLLRTKSFAEIIAEAATQKPPVIEDRRLTELDYGQWSGLSDDEIKAKFGEKTLSDWVDSSIWPENCGWSSNQSTVVGEIEAFVKELKERYSNDANVLVVSSNGRLRYFLKLVKSEFEKRVQEHSFKVATGRVCLLDIGDGSSSLQLWNEQPESLQGYLRSAAGRM